MFGFSEGLICNHFSGGILMMEVLNEEKLLNNQNCYLFLLAERPCAKIKSLLREKLI